MLDAKPSDVRRGTYLSPSNTVNANPRPIRTTRWLSVMALLTRMRDCLGRIAPFATRAPGP
jgi:hypothetical protein